MENYSAFEDLGQKNKLIFSVLHILELQILVD